MFLLVDAFSKQKCRVLPHQIWGDNVSEQMFTVLRCEQKEGNWNQIKEHTESKDAFKEVLISLDENEISYKKDGL